MYFKKVSYYKKVFAKNISSVWGIMTILASTFSCGFIVGRYFEEDLANRQKANMESEYTMKLVDCENDHIREVVELKSAYEREIMELKIKISNNEKSH